MKLDNPFTEPGDKLGFSKVLDKHAAHCKSGMDEFTDFLDPHSLGMFAKALEKRKAAHAIFGGYDGAERCMIGFFAAGEEHCETSGYGGVFPITPISITFNQRFSAPPTHRHYLGSLIGLGFDRGKLGDICLAADGAIAYVQTHVAEFVCKNLLRVCKTSVKADIGKSLTVPDAKEKTKRLTVSSLRLDSFVAAAFNLSRTLACELIDRQKVFVNFRQEKKTHILKVYDKISARGFGRAEIMSVGGITKKGKIAIVVNLFS